MAEGPAPDCECEEQECPAGIPAWVMTFADLMSLLMCFFVLLLSFSEMDAQKFKRLAGSLRNAFGVQDQLQVNEIPKGTSIIAQEFSPATPEPTPINEIRQSTSNTTKNSLEVLCQDEVIQQETMQGEEGKNSREVVIQEKIVTEEEKKEQAEKLAKEIASKLTEEISESIVEIETREDRVIIRLQERGSFDSGSAYVKDEFLPVLDKIREVLVRTPGAISVEGHTDETPSRGRFSSNWLLSAARAVAVAEYLFIAPELSDDRFTVVGHGATYPIAPNDTIESRARNRRVEIVIQKDPFLEKGNFEPVDQSFLESDDGDPYGLDPDEVF